MSTTIGLLLPVLVAGGALGFTIWRSGARRPRRQHAVARGRVVMAKNLVGSRQRVR